MIVYPPIFYGAELKLTFKGKLTWKVADTLQCSIQYFRFWILGDLSTGFVLSVYEVFFTFYLSTSFVAIVYLFFV